MRFSRLPSFRERNVMTAIKDGVSAVSQAADTARDYVEHAGGQLREACSQVAERAGEEYRRAGDVVRHNPGQTVATAFGAGLVVGVLVGWTLSARSR
jgi:ElaB/YqjD/DUF883 family membrane-anchored ribosome-binding protein